MYVYVCQLVASNNTINLIKQYQGATGGGCRVVLLIGGYSSAALDTQSLRVLLTRCLRRRNRRPRSFQSTPTGCGCAQTCAWAPPHGAPPPPSAGCWCAGPRLPSSPPSSLRLAGCAAAPRCSAARPTGRAWGLPTRRRRRRRAPAARQAGSCAPSPGAASTSAKGELLLPRASTVPPLGAPAASATTTKHNTSGQTVVFRQPPLARSTSNVWNDSHEYGLRSGFFGPQRRRRIRATREKVRPARQGARRKL